MVDSKLRARNVAARRLKLQVVLVLCMTFIMRHTTHSSQEALETGLRNRLSRSNVSSHWTILINVIPKILVQGQCCKKLRYFNISISFLVSLKMWKSAGKYNRTAFPRTIYSSSYVLHPCFIYSTQPMWLPIYIYTFFFAVALRPKAGHGHLILEASRSRTTTHHSQ